MDAIASEVRALSEAHDVVLTSGGLGPTPDDVTMAGVAEAFGHLLIRQGRLSHVTCCCKLRACDDLLGVIRLSEGCAWCTTGIKTWRTAYGDTLVPTSRSPTSRWQRLLLVLMVYITLHFAF